MTNKDTHTIPDVEKLITEKLEILKNGETIGEKRKARKEIIMLEKLLRDIDYKKFNGKKYPEQLCWRSDRPDLNDKEKKEVYKLIDSVETDSMNGIDEGHVLQNINVNIDLTGVSVGKTRFSYVDLGWPEPKPPK